MIDISPCRYCNETPKAEKVDGLYRVQWRCLASKRALSQVGEKHLSERLAIKNWNASNDKGGPEILSHERIAELAELTP